MTYNIQYHAIDGSDGGTTASGFSTIDEARIWAAANINMDEFTANDDIVQIHEGNTDTLGEAVEDLN